MAKLPLDLAKFKKCSSNEKHTTLRHKDGHFIKIVHSRISPDIRKALAALEMEGKASDKEMPRSQMADGGKVADKKDDGMKVTYEDVRIGGKSTIGPKEPDEGTYITEEDVHPDSDLHAEGYAGGGRVKGPLNPKLAESKKLPAYAEGTVDGPIQDTDVAEPATEEPAVTQESTPEAASTESNAGSPAPAASPGATPGVNEQDPDSAGPTIAQDLLQHRQAFQEDLQNGHITPETYASLYGKKDTLGKIGTLFGLMVSGAGSGLAHQPNALLQMMDKTIDRDLEAQKLSKENALNFLRIHQNQALIDSQTALHKAQAAGLSLENQKKAMLLPALREQLGSTDRATRMNMEQAAVNHVEQIANKTPPGTPIGDAARATAVALKQQVEQKHAAEIQDAAAKAPTFWERVKSDLFTPGGLLKYVNKHTPGAPQTAQPEAEEPPAIKAQTPEEVASTKASNHLLAPDAQDRMNHLTQGVKIEGLSGQKGLADPDYDDVKKAYERVQSADASLDEATDSYNNLRRLSTPVVSFLANASDATIAGVLAAAGGATGAAIAGTKGAEAGAGAGGAVGATLAKLKQTLGPDAYREYMATLAELDTNISNAMPGLPPTARLGVIHDILPFYKDSAQTDTAKRHALTAKVHSGVRNETALLRRKGMAK